MAVCLALWDTERAPMPLFHYTQLASGEPRPDEVLSTQPGRQTFYWRSVFAPHAYELAAERLRRQHGDADPQLVARAAGCAYLERCFRELLFESVRVSIDPTLPSRSECLFLFNTPGPSMAIDLDDRALLEIEPLPHARLLRARASLLDGSLFAAEIASSAREYWRGAESDGDELLLTGSFRVRRVVREGNGMTIDGKTFVDLHRP
jgi:hypothetical protein